MKTGLKSLLIAGLLANAALAAHAQTTSPAAAPAPMAAASGHSMHHGMRGRMDPAKMEAMMAKRMGELKTKLKITPAQESNWSAFTTAMKPPARTEHPRPDRAEMEKLTTPERIDKMRALRAQRMADRQAQMDIRETATKTFYATLDAEQKKTLDAAHSKMMQRWGEHKGKDHGPRH